MAKRPVYMATKQGKSLVRPILIEFTWHAGLSVSQKQKSIASLHNEAMNTLSISKLLEISSKSPSDLGVRLSAFNLKLKTSGGLIATVESLFQGSKVFLHGGPYIDLYNKASIDSKRDERLRKSGQLIGFRYEGHEWPLIPQTAFYDWLYLSALVQNPELANEIIGYDGFTDIEFNPDKSINCQAASAALYVSLVVRDLLQSAVSSPKSFLEIISSQGSTIIPIQSTLF